jgi:hypothetical protein
VKHVRWFALAALLAVTSQAPPLPSGEPKKGPTGPQYNAKGELKRPTDYRTWVFVGANLGLQYRREAKETTEREKERTKNNKQTFHNVYINPEAYQHYAQTGKFPDKTVLVMEVFEALEREPQNIVERGFYPGKQLAVEVAVKNANRPDGSKTDWAYYAFSSTAQAAGAFPDANCFDCHRQHADDDNVWVQFYPTLRQYQKTKKK